MAKFGPTVINDCDAAKARTKVVYVHRGEERIDRRPAGKVERFVDPQGNIVNIQLAPAGDQNAALNAERKRGQLRREGFVEHAKCPYRHGTHRASVAIERDFESMPRNLAGECDADPKVMSATGFGGRKTLVAHEGCKHIEWLIQDRRVREAEANAKRNTHRIEAEQRAADKLELEQLQLEKARTELAQLKAKRGSKE